MRDNLTSVSIDRQKVLTHHPDKQSDEEQLREGDDLFKCIKIGENRRGVDSEKHHH